MVVIVDKYIPFIKGVLEPFAEVKYLDPADINHAEASTADALFVRTRTRCDASLLNNTKVQFIATATIGYDHIDTEYCKAHQIEWTNAPGCNAQGVCDYIEAAINSVRATGLDLKTIGIIGVGHVGSLVRDMAQRNKLRVLLNDPFKQLNTPLTQIATEADILTFHTPLTTNGEHPTFHLLNKDIIKLCKKDAVIINAARGGVIDEEAMLYHITTNPDCQFKLIIDTWQNEPNINEQLLDKAFLGTYHIAGYTLQGKINATNMCLSAFCNHYGLPNLQATAHFEPTTYNSDYEWLQKADKQLRSTPNMFEHLRETYKLR